MKPLPPELLDACRVSWHMTSWCNYTCNYCGVDIFPKKSKTERQAHAFDYYPVEEWIRGFSTFPQKKIFLKVTGGEPFLDRENLKKFLAGVLQTGRFYIRIDTNGTWDPKYFHDLDKRGIELNISYHPQETNLDILMRRALSIRDAGFDVAQINFVLSPDNVAVCDSVVSAFDAEGFFVNVGPMMAMGAYAGKTDRTEEEIRTLKKYTPPIDVKFRIVNPPVAGRPCYHPAFSYYMLYDGNIQVYCTGAFQNLFSQGIPALPREAVACPHFQCMGCTEMYRAIADEPLAPKLSLYTLHDYSSEVQGYRRKVRWARYLPDFISRPLFSLPPNTKPHVEGTAGPA